MCDQDTLCCVSEMCDQDALCCAVLCFRTAWGKCVTKTHCVVLCCVSEQHEGNVWPRRIVLCCVSEHGRGTRLQGAQAGQSQWRWPGRCATLLYTWSTQAQITCSYSSFWTHPVFCCAMQVICFCFSHLILFAHVSMTLFVGDASWWHVLLWMKYDVKYFSSFFLSSSDCQINTVISFECKYTWILVWEGEVCVTVCWMCRIKIVYSVEHPTVQSWFGLPRAFPEFVLCPHSAPNYPPLCCNVPKKRLIFHHFLRDVAPCMVLITAVTVPVLLCGVLCEYQSLL